MSSVGLGVRDLVFSFWIFQILFFSFLSLQDFHHIQGW